MHLGRIDSADEFSAARNQSASRPQSAMPYALAALPFALDALEPHYATEQLTVHYTKHHQGYANLTTAALAGHEMDGRPILDVLRHLGDIADPELRQKVRNVGGGLYNHEFFWNCLTPAAEREEPSAELAAALAESFGSVAAFKDAFSAAAGKVFGSGWAWLVADADRKLTVVTTPNQDLPAPELVPLMNIDVWEHAYYIQHQNRRPDFIKSFWEIANWRFVSDNFAKLLA
jgi:Fe-Mn family superoxide dismutase